jgi:hypothetical protein
MSRLFVLVPPLLGLFFAGCEARDLSGTYLAKIETADVPGVAYFDLTSTTSASQLTGSLTATGVMATASDGVVSRSIPVTATANEKHLVFYIAGQTASSDLMSDGFTISMPGPDGRIQSMTFHRASIEDVNKAVDDIKQKGQVARKAYLATATATVELTNLSDGVAYFYIDDQLRCTASSGTHCDVAVSVTEPHALSATTAYSAQQSYQTPLVQLQAEPNAVYRFEACGETGSPGSSCGLFTVSNPATP